MREAIIVACGLLRGKMEGVSKKEKKNVLGNYTCEREGSVKVVV